MEDMQMIFKKATIKLDLPRLDNEILDKIQEILIYNGIKFKYSYPRVIKGSKYEFDRKHNILQINSNDIKQVKKMMQLMKKCFYSKIEYIFIPPNTSWPTEVMIPELNLLVKKKDIKKTNNLLKSILK